MCMYVCVWVYDTCMHISTEVIPLELEQQVFLTAGYLPSLRSFLSVMKLKGFEGFSFLKSDNLVVMGGTCLHGNLFYVLGKTANVFFSLPGK